MAPLCVKESNTGGPISAVPRGWNPIIIPPDDEPAAPAVAVMEPPKAAPRPAYREPQAVEGDELPEFATENAIINSL